MEREARRSTRGGSARFHSTDEGFLPTFTEIVQLANDVDPRIIVTAVSPNGRLRFRQVRQHWYGRAFALPMQLLFAMMDRASDQRISNRFGNAFIKQIEPARDRQGQGSACPL